MSFATQHPVIINGVTYAPFKQWNITYNDSVTVHETEGGTQEDVVIHRGRRSIAVQTNCMQPIARTLVCLEDLNNFSVTFYDIKTDTDITTVVRVSPGSMNCNMIEDSAGLDSVKGLYNVSFVLEEYE